MSLRSFHILFIVLSLGLLAFMVTWSGRHLLAGEDGVNTAMALSAAAGILVGVPYLGWFIKKTKTL